MLIFLYLLEVNILDYVFKNETLRNFENFEDFWPKNWSYL